MSDRPPQRRTEPTAGRRTVLAGVGAVGATLFAGCSALIGGPLGNSSATNESETTRDSQPSDAPATTATTTPPEQGFEADVVGIAGVSNEGRSYSFNPILQVAEGERSDRVERWLVESLAGDEVASFPVDKSVEGPRFQVGGTADIPDGVSGVVIRGEHVANGFGGYGLLIRLEDYAFERVQQGTERQSFADFTFDE